MGEEPGAGFLRYVGVLAGALACAQSVVLTSRFIADEDGGRLELERSTGPGPARLLGARTVSALVAAGSSLAGATPVGVLAAPLALAGAARRDLHPSDGQHAGQRRGQPAGRR